MNRGPIGTGSDKKKNNAVWVWFVVFLAIIAAAGIWYASAGKGANVLTGTNTDITIRTGEYQAVFLDNGQVYFGKLDRKSEDFYNLTDVYYLQTGTVGLDQASNLSLSKLGNEAHGPEDKMEINVEHILFIEDMKEDSKVVGAIKEHKRK
jgi:hypothetical protein